MNKHYPDPYTEATNHTAQRGMQIVALLVAVRRFHVVRNDRRKREETSAIQTGGAPAHDPGWLVSANLSQTVRAWRAALPFADADPAAASAVRLCEDRLRTLHPYAMARYDRLRDDGMPSAEAMTEVAALFACRRFAHTGEAGPAPPGLPPVAASRTVADLVAEDFPRDIATAMRAAAEPSTPQRPLRSLPKFSPRTPRRSVK